MFAALLTAALVAQAPPEQPVHALMTAEQLRDVKRGQAVVVTQTERGQDGHDQGRALAFFLIKRPWREVWDQLTDYDRQWEYMPRVERTRVVDTQNDGLVKWVHHAMTIAMVDIEYTMVQRLIPERRRVEFVLDASRPSDVPHIEGSWQFEAVDKGRKTLIAYSIFVRSGTLVPQFVQDFLTRRDLPEMLDNLRKRVTSGGTWRKG
jgi:hypothetical protein